MSEIRSLANWAGVIAVSVAAGVLLNVGCSSDDGKASEAEAGHGSADNGGAPAETVGGAPSSAGTNALGGSSQGGATGVAGASEPSDGGVGMVAAGGAPPQGGDCLVKVSMNDSNAIDAATPLSEKCLVETFDGQINFTIMNGTFPDGRQITVDFFADPVKGASVKLEDGYDFAAHQGAHASYVDSQGVWAADKGTVTITSVSGDDYVLTLENAHFAVSPGPGGDPASGTFVASGTISGTAMAGM